MFYWKCRKKCCKIKKHVYLKRYTLGGRKNEKKNMERDYRTGCVPGCSCACKKSVGTPEDNATANENTETDAEEEEDTSEEEEVKYKFGFSGIDMQNPYFITLESAVKEGLGDEDYRMITKDPGSDPDLQNQQIQEMIDEGIDAIFLSPVDWEKISTSLRH